MPKPQASSWLVRSLFPRSSGTRLQLLFAAALGVATGVGAYTFSYAKGLSYFGTDPRACVNCHIMEPQYSGWQKSSHHAVARCIDCHLPTSFVDKYLAKAENGYRHGKLFTTQTFEEPITIKAAGREILQANCERCHSDLIHGLIGMGELGFESEGASARAAQGGKIEAAESRIDCVHCHWTVGHGERAGLGGPPRADRRPGVEASEGETEL